MFEAIQSFDLQLLSWMRSLHDPLLAGFAWVISTVAWKGWLWWLVIGSSWLRGRRQFSVHLAMALLIGVVAGLPLKGLIARPRPDLYASQQLNIPMPELLSTQHSFPSGHTLMAAAFAFVVFSYYKDYRSWLAFAFVVLVGLARVYGGYHWPSDVIGSVVMGGVAALIAGKVCQLPVLQRLIAGRLAKDGRLAANLEIDSDKAGKSNILSGSER